MHVSLPAVPEQIQVARRIVRNELAGLGWPEAKIAACEEIAAQLARHAIGLVGVSGYYLGVTKRRGPEPEDAVAIRVSVTILDALDALDALAEDETGSAGPGPDGPDGLVRVPAQGGPSEVLTKRCGTQVDVVTQSGSWVASVTLPSEPPRIGARP